MSNAIDNDLLDVLLPRYYKRLFPHYLMCKWLGYSEGTHLFCLCVYQKIINKLLLLVQREFFHHREFSFTLKDDIYLRYLTFSDYIDFEKELLKRVPYKIDIGGVYNHIVSKLS